MITSDDVQKVLVRLHESRVAKKIDQLLDTEVVESIHPALCCCDACETALIVETAEQECAVEDFESGFGQGAYLDSLR